MDNLGLVKQPQHQEYEADDEQDGTHDTKDRAHAAEEQQNNTNEAEEQGAAQVAIKATAGGASIALLQLGRLASQLVELLSDFALGQALP